MLLCLVRFSDYIILFPTRVNTLGKKKDKKTNKQTMQIVCIYQITSKRLWRIYFEEKAIFIYFTINIYICVCVIVAVK